MEKGKNHTVDNSSIQTTESKQIIENEQYANELEMRKTFKHLMRVRRIRSTLIWILVIGIIVAIVLTWFNMERKKLINGFMSAEPSLSVETITAKIEAASDLVTSKVTLKGVAEFSDGGWWFFNKGDFVLVYTSEVKAGIDVKKVDLTVDDGQKIVYIYVPKAEILSVKILPESIKYYNESFALLNFDKKEDANRAQKMAEEVAEKDALGAGVLEAANTQSEILIRGILEEVVGNYEMRFVSSENELQRMKDLIETTKTTDSSKATADSATNKND
ncbi:MAG: DUF4230 domain-containing protein [Ruminococcus sp.]|nr:DUF4230 domain-containing protein [Ruminococcus sp.]